MVKISSPGRCQHFAYLCPNHVADQKMLEFRPSIVGISALWCTLDQLFPPKSDTYIAYIMSILNQSQKVITNQEDIYIMLLFVLFIDIK